MNIAFLSTHLNTGGITSYLYTLGKGLVERGHTVHVLTSGGNCEEDFRSQHMKLQTINIQTKSELSLKLYGNLSRIKNYVLEKDIQIIHAQTRVTQVAGRLLKKMTRRAYVSTCHGFFKPRFSRKLFPCWGDRVIAISDPVLNHLHDDFKIPKSQIDLIPNGIDLQDFSIPSKIDKEKIRETFSLGNEPLVGIIARLSDVKGQDILVSAFKKVAKVIPEAKLLLVGEGKLEPVLRHQVETLGLQKNIVFLPVVNKPAEMLALFDIFVMPSRQEGLGLSVMEAQAAGLPVIASKVGGLPSLIEHEQTGILINPGNIEQLGIAIIDLLQDKNKALRLGQKARKKAEEKYSSEWMVEKTLKTYQEVI